MNKQTLRNLVLIWVLWAIILIGYMEFASLRYVPEKPDEALVWSAQETNRRSLKDKPYLRDPLLNSLVAWDSEYYISVATVGYDDPDMRLIESGNEAYSTSYAFFPLYPYLMKVVRLPLSLFDVTPIGASTLAGVMISLLGALVGMIALYDIVKEDLGDIGSIRTGFLFLVFPTSFFFATVYTEGLFVALAFSSLAFMRRNNLLVAAILAGLATLTRSIGGALLIPLAYSWVMMFQNTDSKQSMLLQLPYVGFPLLAYGLWRYFFGVPFDFVQENWFGNQLFSFEKTKQAWELIWERAFTGTETFTETQVVVVLTIASIILCLVSCVLCLKKYPRLAIFGFIALVVPLTGGWTGTQSTIRYVLAVPTLFVMLGQWSQNIVFEKTWTLLSVLLLAMLAFLFSFDMWVA